LRLEANNALNQALQLSQQVLPCFIFDPRQIQPHPYQSVPAITFMLPSLNDLQMQLQQPVATPSRISEFLILGYNNKNLMPNANSFTAGFQN